MAGTAMSPNWRRRKRKAWTALMVLRASSSKYAVFPCRLLTLLTSDSVLKLGLSHKLRSFLL